MGKVRLPLELEFDGLNTMIRFLAGPGPGITVVTGEETGEEPADDHDGEAEAEQKAQALASPAFKGHDRDGNAMWKARAFTPGEDRRILQAWADAPSGTPAIDVARTLEFELMRTPAAIAQRLRIVLRGQETGQ